MKKQIWLRPDQSQFVVDCLHFVLGRMNYELSSKNATDTFARETVIKTVKELIPLFEVMKDK